MAIGFEKFLEGEIANAYTKNLGNMTLLQCEVEAAKHHATMFYPDAFQHPANGTNSWRWRTHGTYGVYSPNHSYHYETPASSTYACSLIKQVGSNTTATTNGRTTNTINESQPWATGTANGYTYNIYRTTTTDPYVCSLFLRVNGLQVYGKGVQSMLSNKTATMSNGISGLCSHGYCGDTYGYLYGNTTQSDIYGDSTQAVNDGYCYGYTIYK